MLRYTTMLRGTSLKALFTQLSAPGEIVSRYSSIPRKAGMGCAHINAVAHGDPVEQDEHGERVG